MSEYLASPTCELNTRIAKWSLTVVTPSCNSITYISEFKTPVRLDWVGETGS
jgi:hypothetical protein